MKTKTVELRTGVIETRYYDKSGKLVEIRRKQPPGKIDRTVSMLKRTPGTYTTDRY